MSITTRLCASFRAARLPYPGVLALMMVLGQRSVGAQPSPAAILDRIGVNPRRAIDFHAAVLPDTVYVGQQVTYQVAVLISMDAKARLRRNPEFVPPEFRGLIAYELGQFVRAESRTIGGVPWQVYVFQRALFPVTAGTLAIPAPQLTYALPPTTSYFSRETQYALRAESTTVVARPLPMDGQPDDFAGAVGTFGVTARVDGGRLRVGDPSVLTVRVQGTGNVKLLQRPALELPWGSLVPSVERVQIDSSGAVVRGSKEFDWIITPRQAGLRTVPAVTYSVFDPRLRRYVRVDAAPVMVTIDEGEAAPVDSLEATDVLPLRTVSLRSEDVVPESDNTTRWWWWVIVAVPLPAAGWWLRAQWRRHRGIVAAPDRGKTDALSMAPHEADARESVRCARRDTMAALAVRLQCGASELGDRAFLLKRLRRFGVTRVTARALVETLAHLDALGFAPNAGQGEDVSIRLAVVRRASDLLRQVDEEAMPAGGLPRHLLMIGVIVLGSMADASHAVHAMPVRALAQTSQPRSLKDDWDATQTAYEQRAFTEARDRLGALVTRAPGNVDLLVNWGTAAWQAADTVTAVIAWQRAARRDPMARDVQQRLQLLPAGARGGVAAVPMVPVILFERIGLITWSVGWLMLFAGLRRDDRRVLWVAATVIGLGLGSGAGAAWGARRLSDHTLSVVLRPETMRVVPGADADAIGGVSTGDVVQRIERREAWQRVCHADGRCGWLPADRLVMVSAEPEPR